MSADRSLKNLLIMPGFQLKLMAYFASFFLISTATLYSTIWLIFWKINQKALKVGIPDGHVFYRFMQDQKTELEMLFIGVVVFFLLVLVTIVLYLSHRIAGPVYKLKNHLQSLPKEDAEAIDFQLRKKDFFKELVHIIKELESKVKGRHE